MHVAKAAAERRPANKRSYNHEFRMIVGSIVTLANGLAGVFPFKKRNGKLF